MTQIRICHLMIPLAMLLLTSCAREGTASKPPQGSELGQDNAPAAKPVAENGSTPVPPLDLAEPPELAGKLEDTDFKDMEADELIALARAAAAKGVYDVAAIAQYWFHRKTDRGQYDLACYLARTGQIDPAFYWLQKAAIDEGVDPPWALQDQDLASLRLDRRWKPVLSYLEACSRYFETANLTKTVLILPQGYEKTAAIPAVVWLHGFGSRPNDFVNEGAQEYADQLNIALIGVSGTKPRGPHSFVWAEDIEQDAKRVRAALAEVSDRVTIEPGKVITFGFSQGAQMGLEIAVKYPEEFSGSIVLSPGADSHLRTIKPSPLLADRRFVISCGAQEQPGNVFLAKNANDWLLRAKAEVKYLPYAGVSAHSFPSDFGERFPEWVNFILNVK